MSGILITAFAASALVTAGGSADTRSASAIPAAAMTPHAALVASVAKVPVGACAAQVNGKSKIVGAKFATSKTECRTGNQLFQGNGGGASVGSSFVSYLPTIATIGAVTVSTVIITQNQNNNSNSPR